MRYVHEYDSPLGRLTLASDGQALTGLWFEGQRFFAAGLSPEPDAADLEVFDAAARWLDIYFSGREPDFTLPLAPAGTPFRMAVWALLREIPYGETITYGQLARRLPRGAARAVGEAAARNPISILIPCHRLLGADGSLTGYAGGVERKRALLRLEGNADIQ